ncbi:mucin-5AC-like isoform X2 [Salvelinus fontinalis]|uniref:mucin-5AC-like isoform X2 n=1 Tax=Salvelinus fontinalis TaxID=8038 RepID=UPI00248551B7|nr:mucin-5AC-like isoform X2 [Salvelinus fontinalis]
MVTAHMTGGQKVVSGTAAPGSSSSPPPLQTSSINLQTNRGSGGVVLQPYSRREMLGNLTVVPIKVPQVSPLHRLSGQASTVLPQVQPKSVIPASLLLSHSPVSLPKEQPASQKQSSCQTLSLLNLQRATAVVSPKSHAHNFNHTHSSSHTLTQSHTLGPALPTANSTFSPERLSVGQGDTATSTTSSPPPLAQTLASPLASLQPQTLASPLAQTLASPLAQTLASLQPQTLASPLASLRTLASLQPQTLASLQPQTQSLAQTQSLSPAQIQSLSPAQTQSLSLAQTQSLSLAQTQSLTLAQTQSLSLAQTQSLTLAQTQSLTLAQTQSLTPAQTQSLSLAQTQSLTPAQTQSLSLAHPQSLSPAQTQSLSLALAWPGGLSSISPTSTSPTATSASVPPGVTFSVISASPPADTGNNRVWTISEAVKVQPLVFNTDNKKKLAVRSCLVGGTIKPLSLIKPPPPLSSQSISISVLPANPVAKTAPVAMVTAHMTGGQKVVSGTAAPGSSSSPPPLQTSSINLQTNRGSGGVVLQPYSRREMLGNLTVVPIKVPQVSPLHRLSGQASTVLPQVQPKSVIPASLLLSHSPVSLPKEQPASQKQSSCQTLSLLNLQRATAVVSPKSHAHNFNHTHSSRHTLTQSHTLGPALPTANSTFSPERLSVGQGDTATSTTSSPPPLAQTLASPLASLQPQTLASPLAQTLASLQPQTLASPLASLQTLASLQPQTLASLQPQTQSLAQTQSLSLAQIQSLSPAQIQSLSPAQTQSLSPAQTQSLSPAQTQSLSPAQTQSLTLAQTQSLTPAQTQSLTPAQTQSLSPAQTQSLSLALAWPGGLSSISPTSTSPTATSASVPPGVTFSVISASPPADTGNNRVWTISEAVKVQPLVFNTDNKLKIIQPEAAPPSSSQDSPGGPQGADSPSTSPSSTPAKKKKKQKDEDPEKMSFMVALGLVTTETLEEIQIKRQERKRRSTANPAYSGLVQPERKRLALNYLNNPLFLSVRATGDYRWKEELEHDDHCSVCKEDGELQLCHNCPRAYHPDCLHPPLRTPPRGVWVCTKCQKKVLNKENMSWPQNFVQSYVTHKTVREGEKRSLLRRNVELKKECAHLEEQDQQLSKSLTKVMDVRDRLIGQQRDTQSSLERLKALIRLIQRDQMIQVTMTATATTTGVSLLSLPWIKPSAAAAATHTVPPAGPSMLLQQKSLIMPQSQTQSQGNV